MSGERIVNIDALKGLAIVSVFLLHSLDTELRSAIHSIIHIGQAVPVFVLITFYLSFLSLDKNGRSIKDSYNLSRVKKMIERIVCPFAIVTVVQCVLLLYVSRFQPLSILIGGGTGQDLTMCGYIYKYGF